MKIPATLYRFRPLAGVFDRELDALRNSFLFAAGFKTMNDPMEAFYETGGPGDRIVDAMLGPAGKSVTEMYKVVDEMIASFALLSFTGTYEALPLWAYYAGNFAGMCLEFDTARLCLGDLQNEKLAQVTYARDPLPSLSVVDFPDMEDAVLSRISRKRIEWSHEREWRFVAGTVGKKHFLDDALVRVYLGPRIEAGHATAICAALKERPVEILQGEVKGFDLRFSVLQPAAPLDKCERVGAGSFDPARDIFDETAARAFLGRHYDRLIEECKRTAARPNMQEFIGIDLSPSKPGTLFMNTTYQLRSGRTMYETRHFDNRMNLVARNS